MAKQGSRSKQGKAKIGQLSKAEALFQELRELLFSCSQELARSGGANWERAEALFQLAKNADQLQRSVISVLSREQAPVTVSLPPAAEKPKAAGAGKQSRKPNYPKYRVRGNLLFKTGLSRDARREYEHVLPKQDFDSFISFLAQLSAERTDFGVEALRSKLSCPAYQIYTVLSLLKSRGILQVPKRGLYSFRTPGAFPAEAANLWEELQH
jgi:hypothetical protein